MKKKDNEKKRKIDLIVKIVLIIIIILLLIHNCVLKKGMSQYNIPNGNVDIIDIKCDDNKCKPIIPTSSPLKPMKIESLSFAQKKVSVLKGDSLTLIVTVNPTELSSSKLTWTSSNPKIVSVDSKGRIKALAEGTVTITVTSANGKKATCTVTVTNSAIDVTEIELKPGKSTIDVGSVTQVSATIKPENATNRELIWESSDSEIAIVSDKGIVQGVNPGTVTITAKTADGKVIATCTITVKAKATPTPTPMQITSVTFLQDNVSVQIGSTLTLPVEIKPSELASSSLTWTSSDPTVASVDANGVVTGLKAGTTTITVKSANGKTDTCTVNVRADVIDVTAIELSTNNITINAGMSTQIGATVKPTNATNKNLLWTSSDEDIVTVDSNGWINALVEGTVTITVRSVDGNAVATCTVVVDNDDGSDTVKVYDKEKTPVTWNGADDLKIFTKSIYNMDGVIAPESSNTYKFIVKNSTEYNIKYSINFIESNDFDINMKYKLKRNDTYVVDHYVSYDELDITDQILNTNTTDTYYLEWKWVSSSNDTSIGQNPSASYGLQIEVEAESING